MHRRKWSRQVPGKKPVGRDPGWTVTQAGSSIELSETPMLVTGKTAILPKVSISEKEKCRLEVQRAMKASHPKAEYHRREVSDGWTLTSTPWNPTSSAPGFYLTYSVTYKYKRRKGVKPKPNPKDKPLRATLEEKCVTCGKPKGDHLNEWMLCPGRHSLEVFTSVSSNTIKHADPAKVKR